MGRQGGSTDDITGMLNVRLDTYVQNDIMLSDLVTPIEYDLDIVVMLEPDFITDGYFVIRGNTQISPEQENGHLSFHFQEMFINESTLTLTEIGNNNAELEIITIIIDHSRNIFRMEYRLPLDLQNAMFDFELSGNFVGIIQDPIGRGQYGFYRDFYFDIETGIKTWMAVTTFETDDTRRGFPCIDEPDKKANFRIKIGHKANLVAQSNGIVTATGAPVSGYPGYIWTEFSQTKLMSPYLVAFAVSDFTFTEVQSGSTTHRTWSRYDAINEGLADYVMEIAPALVSAYENMFNHSYPLNKLEQISPPTKLSAMENWGLITYKETGLLINVSLSSATQHRNMISVQAHEISHQWFGDLVTCDWWGYLWLNEGFATYLSILGSNAVAPEIDNFERYLVDELYYAFEADQVIGNHPVSQTVNNPDETDFGSITYSKGSAIIRMAESFLTYGVWLEGMQTYLDKFEYGTVVPDNIFYEWDYAAKQNGILANDEYVKDIMDTWTVQEGFPVLLVMRNYNQGIVDLRQEAFFLDGSNTHDNKWWIPITYTLVNNDLTDFEDTFNYDLWLRPEENEKIIPVGQENDTAIIFNIQYTAFYRTNYDNKNWNMLSQELAYNYSSIHVNNRVQLLDDSYALAKAGYHENFVIAEGLYSYMYNETRYAPLELAKRTLQDIMNSNSSSSTENLKEIIQDVFRYHYSVVGLDEVKEESWNYNKAQSTIVEAACLEDNSECQYDCKVSFANYMNVPDPDDILTHPINRHVRDLVYCIAVRLGTEIEVNFLLERLSNVRNPQERLNILHGLECSQE